MCNSTTTITSMVERIESSSMSNDLVKTCGFQPELADSSEADGATERHQQQSRKDRCVTFTRTVKVYSHIHINDMPHRIVSRAWYNQEELSHIKEEVYEIANAISLVEESSKSKNRGAAITNSSYSLHCPRGLEYRTIEGAQRRRRNRKRAWDAVLDEQERQWEKHGAVDSEALATAYRVISEKSATEAHQNALSDADEANFDKWSLGLKIRYPDTERVFSLAQSSPITTCTRAA